MMKTIGAAIKAVGVALGLVERAQVRRDRQEERNLGRTQERAEAQSEALEGIRDDRQADEAFDRLDPAQRDELQRRNRERRSRR